MTEFTSRLSPTVCLPLFEMYANDGKRHERTCELARQGKGRWLGSASMPGWSQIPTQAISDFNTRSGTAKLERVELPEITLGAYERGAVLSPLPAEFFVGPGHIEVTHSDFDQSVVRTALLFFDKFIIARSNGLNLDSPFDELISLGLASKGRAVYSGVSEDGLRQSPADIFFALHAKEPGLWTLHRSASQLGFPEEEMDPRAGFQITLENALPTFTREVPLESVLEFKAKHVSEVLSLRHHIHALVSETDVSDPSSKIVAVEKFGIALSDYVKVMRETNLHRVVNNLKLSVSWDKAIPALTDIALTHHFPIAGAISSSAMVVWSAAKGLKRVKGASPFEYLTSAEKDLY